MRTAIAFTLAFFCNATLADECRCKRDVESVFAPAACPVIGAAAFVGTPTPGFWFDGIDIDLLMQIMGEFSGHTVCLGKGVQGKIYVKAGKGTPWTSIVTDVSIRYGFRAKIDSTHVYVYKP